MPSVKPSELPILGFATAREWSRWLAAQPRSSKGVWLKLAKKESGVLSVSRQEAVDAALCHGWIDGQLQKFDERHWLIRFTPRAARSRWSEINRTRAQELIDCGDMRPAGLAEIERARKDGRWEAAYPAQSKAAVPEDLQTAFDGNPAAKKFFATLDSRNRYAILHRTHHAKGLARTEKIGKFVKMLARGETIYPLKAKSQGRVKAKSQGQVNAKGSGRVKAKSQPASPLG